MKEFVESLRKDNEELRNLIRGKLDGNDQSNYHQSNVNTMNNDSIKNFQNPLNQTGINRVNKFK